MINVLRSRRLLALAGVNLFITLDDIAKLEIDPLGPAQPVKFTQPRSNVVK